MVRSCADDMAHVIRAHGAKRRRDILFHNAVRFLRLDEHSVTK
jgi:hypothetical protein